MNIFLENADGNADIPPGFSFSMYHPDAMGCTKGMNWGCQVNHALADPPHQTDPQIVACKMQTRFETSLSKTFLPFSQADAPLCARNCAGCPLLKRHFHGHRYTKPRGLARGWSSHHAGLLHLVVYTQLYPGDIRNRRDPMCCCNRVGPDLGVKTGCGLLCTGIKAAACWAPPSGQQYLAVFMCTVFTDLMNSIYLY